MCYNGEYEGGGAMTKQQINTTYLASEIFRVERALAACPDYCLSRKRNKKNGRDYWYRQYPASQGRKQVYIKKKDVAAERAAVARKKELKKRLRDLKAQYKALSFAQRKDVRYLTSCYREAEAAGVGEIEKNTHLDGTSRDSKSEIMISMILEKFGVKYKYGYSIMAAGYRHIVDFFFPESGDYYEHMGKLDDEKYKNDQKEKLAHYEAENIKPNENLLITSEHYVPEKKYAYFDARKIVLSLSAFGKISPHKAFKCLFPHKKAKL